MRAIRIETRKTGTSKNISDAHFCNYENCYKPAKHTMTFLDYLWDQMKLCDKHQKEMKEILGRIYGEPPIEPTDG